MSHLWLISDASSILIYPPNSVRVNWKQPKQNGYFSTGTKEKDMKL